MEMIQTSECCSVGHPDRMCDYIASYILDRWLEKDPYARVALEVQLKGPYCTVSGEVTSSWRFRNSELAGFCRTAVKRIGYTDAYQAGFGEENTISGDDLEVALHISQQSTDIALGIDADGWGDQGIFWGLAVDSPEKGNMPSDHWWAREVANSLYLRSLGGHDIKTQVTVRNGVPVSCVVAIPVPAEDEMVTIPVVMDHVQALLGKDCAVTVNGTGRYVTHGPVGDCGTTGRKLVADFYGGNCRIGGGSPWGKDPTKADVALNVYARKLALDYMREHCLDWVQCGISCCIGRREIDVSFFDRAGALLETHRERQPASRIIESLGLRRPCYAERCAKGLFGYE